MDRRRHALLHNQRALYFKRTLLLEPWVVAVNVPYRVGAGLEHWARPDVAKSPEPAGPNGPATWRPSSPSSLQTWRRSR